MKKKNKIEILRNQYDSITGFKVPTDCTYDFDITLLQFIRDGLKKFLEVNDTIPTRLYEKNNHDEEAAVAEFKREIIEIVNLCNEAITAHDVDNGENLQAKNIELFNKLAPILHEFWW